MWLACYTQEEIAETVGLDRTVITRQVEKLEEMCKSAKLRDVQLMAANHSDLQPLPIYNVWKQKEYRSDKKHFCYAKTRLKMKIDTPHRFLENKFYVTGATALTLVSPPHRFLEN